LQWAAEEAGEIELVLRFRDRLAEVLQRRCAPGTDGCLEA
jgi:hypothetical protein